MASLLATPVDFTEHERFLRAPLTRPVRLWARAQSTETDARLISAGGVTLESDTALEPGERVRVQLRLDDVELTLDAEVVRVERGGFLRAATVGVRFLELTPADQRVVVAFVMRHRAD